MPENSQSCEYMLIGSVWSSSFVSQMDAEGASVAEVQQEAWLEYSEEMKRRLTSTVWKKGKAVHPLAREILFHSQTPLMNPPDFSRFVRSRLL